MAGVEGADTMTLFFIGFGAGCLVGACVGFLMIALCVASRAGDAHLEGRVCDR